nr:hypothetical protein [uncultured Methanomethylovorans sp.]
MTTKLDKTIVERGTGSASKSCITLSEYSRPNIQLEIIPKPIVPRVKIISVESLNFEEFHRADISIVYYYFL